MTVPLLETFQGNVRGMTRVVLKLSSQCRKLFPPSRSVEFASSGECQGCPKSWVLGETNLSKISEFLTLFEKKAGSSAAA